MFKALRKDTNKVILIDEVKNPKNYNWECPHCNSKVSHVIEHEREGNKVIEHFRHTSDQSCKVGGESLYHELMKRTIYNLFKHNLKKLDMEIPIGNRIADVFGITNKNQKIVFECQHSPITNAEIIERTLDYNENGCFVFWILGEPNFLKENREWDMIRTRPSERWLHKNNWGRVYYMDIEKEEIYPVHFLWKGSRVYRDKSMGKINNLGLLCFDSPDGFKLARFYDKKWW